MDKKDETQSPYALEHYKVELEKYKITLDFLKFEATTLWQIYNAFFVGHAIFIGFISTALVGKGFENVNFVLLLLGGIIGFILSFLWLGSFHGNSRWYYFRMGQAKDSEEKFVDSINDPNWYLLNKDAAKFANGIKNKYAGYGMIFIFMTIYFFIILWSIIKLNCNC